MMTSTEFFKDEKPPIKIQAPKNDGMSLRDYFAGQALVGISTNPGSADSVDELSEAAYLMADSMLAERGKE